MLTLCMARVFVSSHQVHQVRGVAIRNYALHPLRERPPAPQDPSPGQGAKEDGDGRSPVPGLALKRAEFYSQVMKLRRRFSEGFSGMTRASPPELYPQPSGTQPDAALPFSRHAQGRRISRTRRRP